jgi:hypothetical protein
VVVAASPDDGSETANAYCCRAPNRAPKVPASATLAHRVFSMMSANARSKLRGSTGTPVRVARTMSSSTHSLPAASRSSASCLRQFVSTRIVIGSNPITRLDRTVFPSDHCTPVLMEISPRRSGSSPPPSRHRPPATPTTHCAATRTTHRAGTRSPTGGPPWPPGTARPGLARRIDLLHAGRLGQRHSRRGVARDQAFTSTRRRASTGPGSSAWDGSSQALRPFGASGTNGWRASMAARPLILR